MFEEDMDTAEEFLKHLDTRARWEPHMSERIPLLYSIAARCLEPRPKRSAEVVDLIPEFEKVRCDTEALDTKFCFCKNNKRTIDRGRKGAGAW